MVDILQYPDERLRVPTIEVVEFDSALADVAHLVKVALINEHPRGAAVAANQIGATERMFVSVTDDGDYEYFVNPVLTVVGNELWTFREGCLSIRDQWWYIERPRVVRIDWQDLAGKQHSEMVTDFPARLYQHEVDHLDGILLIDWLVPGLRKQFERKRAKNAR